MEKILYFEINTVAIIILTVLLLEFRRKRADRFLKDQRIFERMVVVNILLLLFDSLITAANGNPAPWAVVLNYFACFSFYALDPVMGLLYLPYCDSKLEVPSRAQRRHVRFCLALGGANLLLTTASLFRPALFWLDESNRYLRGPWFLLCVAPSYLVMLWGMLEVIAYRRRGGRRSDRLYQTLLLLPIPPIIGSILQVLLPGISIVWISSMISLLIVFISIQNVQITTDPLTGLFNRGQLQPYLRWRTQRWREGVNLYLVMLDIDNFKQINDQFGHPVGDEALIAATRCIRAAGRSNDFLVRYGGDEFVIVAERSDEAEVRLLLRTLQKMAGTVDAVYTLSFSAGYSQWMGCSDLQEFLTDADRRMYRIKAVKRSCGQNGDAALRT